jgi:hypothetical protein
MVAGMGRSLSLVVALLVALFVGVVPLRVCWSMETGGQGVVSVGSHSHGAHGDGSACVHEQESCGHRHDAHDNEGDTEDDDGHGTDACCVDSPFHAVASVHAVSADRSMDATGSILTPIFGAASPSDVATSSDLRARAPAPPEVREPVSTGLITTVLLR